MRTRLFMTAVAAVVLATGTGRSAGLADSLKKGTPNVKAAGALAFGPEGILFIGDPSTATVHAVATGDTKPGMGDVKVENVDEAVAGLLGIKAADLMIRDMKVNPASGNVYLAVARGRGPDAAAVVVKIGSDGKPTEVSLKDVPCASASIANASEKQKTASITGMQFVKGALIVSGLSSEEWAANLRSIPFPFAGSSKGAGVQIFHGAHGAYETRSPIQTFTAYDIAGQTNLLASYTCTPLVKIPVDSLKDGEKVKGTTVAELGNRNRPLDIITYSKGGKDFALIANSARGVMKVSLEGIGSISAITERVNGTAGLKYDTIKELDGTMQLDKAGDKAVLLIKSGDHHSVKTIALP